MSLNKSFVDSMSEKLVVLEKVREKLKEASTKTMAKKEEELQLIEQTILKLCVKPRTSSQIVQLFPARQYNVMAIVEQLKRKGLLHQATNKYVTSLEYRNFEPVMTMTAEKKGTEEVKEIWDGAETVERVRMLLATGILAEHQEEFAKDDWGSLPQWLKTSLAYNFAKRGMVFATTLPQDEALWKESIKSTIASLAEKGVSFEGTQEMLDYMVGETGGLTSEQKTFTANLFDDLSKTSTKKIADDDLPEDSFDAYLVTALWAEEPEDSEEWRNITIYDFDAKSRKSAEEDWRHFQAEAGDLIEGLDLSEVASDFWFTRNGHGVGFMDRHYASKETLKKLTDLSQSFGSVYLEIGDDGKVYYYSNVPTKYSHKKGERSMKNIYAELTAELNRFQALAKEAGRDPNSLMEFTAYFENKPKEEFDKVSKDDEEEIKEPVKEPKKAPKKEDTEKEPSKKEPSKKDVEKAPKGKEKESDVSSVGNEYLTKWEGDELSLAGIHEDAHKNHKEIVEQILDFVLKAVDKKIKDLKKSK